MCENIREVFDEIENKINEKQKELNVIEEENKLIFIIPLNTKKIKECIFEIDLINTINFKIDNLSSHITILINEIKDLKQKNINLEEKSKSFEEKYNKLNEENDSLKNELNSMKKDINNLKEKYDDILNKIELNSAKNQLNKTSNIMIDSKIINNNEEYLKSLNNWIKSNKNLKAELLYRLSRDGNLISTFHEKCDNITPTLLIAQSSNNRKFGGYTSLNWSMDSQTLIDNKTFLFSFDENKKYEKKNNNFEDIQKGVKYGPYFGHCDLMFKNNMNNCKSYNYGKYNFLDGNVLANNTKDSFDVIEVEIYKVIEL